MENNKNKITRSVKFIALSIAVITTITFTQFAKAINIGVVGDSLSAEYYADYDPTGLMTSITESFGTSLLPSNTDCNGGNFGSGILTALLDAILPLVPMRTDLPDRNWVEQLARKRAGILNFGAFTTNPNLYGEPRLRGYEFNFARVSGTVLAPGLGGHDMQQQITGILPYIYNHKVDVVFVMLGSNDFAARELKQQSFCDSSWFTFQNNFINALFHGVDSIRYVGGNKILIGLLPLGTASGIAKGIVLQRINETNARIDAEAAARGIATVDVWQFNEDTARTNPVNGDMYLGPYTIPRNSLANIDDAVTVRTPGAGIIGACTSGGKCGTLKTTLKFVSTDHLHPSTAPQGFIANEIVAALNQNFGYDIQPLSDQEILESGGTFVPQPGKLSDTNKWVQIRQKGPNQCLTLASNNVNLTVASCSSGNTKQRWYVIPFDGRYMLRSAYTLAGHTNGTCIYDDGWYSKVKECRDESSQMNDIYGGGADRDWFIKADNRDSCKYQYSMLESGKVYGTLGNCGLSWGWNYMRWGFYLQGSSVYTLSAITQ